MQLFQNQCEGFPLLHFFQDLDNFEKNIQNYIAENGSFVSLDM